VNFTPFDPELAKLIAYLPQASSLDLYRIEVAVSKLRDEPNRIIAIRSRLHPVAATAWGRDPFARGSYSHAKPGHAEARCRTRSRRSTTRLLPSGSTPSAHWRGEAA